MVADMYAEAQLRRPRLRLLLTEPARGTFQHVALPWASPWLARAPRGDGHDVLVLPGLGAGDASTRLLRGFLRRLGYRAHGWRLGVNQSPTAAVVDGLPSLLRRLAEAGGPVSVIGWSLGGIFARELAREHGPLVRQVITLGSPFMLTDTRHSWADGAFRARARRHVRGDRDRARIRLPIDVPSTAIYSRADGIVPWRACIEPTSDRHENVAVRCSHLGFGGDPATYWVIADRLAQAAGDWSPFVPPPAHRRRFPTQR